MRWYLVLSIAFFSFIIGFSLALYTENQICGITANLLAVFAPLGVCVTMAKPLFDWWGTPKLVLGQEETMSTRTILE